MERLSADVSTIETLRAQHYATVHSFIASEDRAGLEQWLAMNGMASWLVADCPQSLLESRAYTAVNDWCNVRLGHSSLLAETRVAVATFGGRRRAGALLNA